MLVQHVILVEKMVLFHLKITLYLVQEFSEASYQLSFLSCIYRFENNNRPKVNIKGRRRKGGGGRGGRGEEGGRVERLSQP